MRSRKVIVNNHVIEFCQPGPLDSGSVFEEIVLYDGQEKCRGSTLTGGRYTFAVVEDGTSVEYRLAYHVPLLGLGRGSLRVERNGIVVYHEM